MTIHFLKRLPALSVAGNVIITVDQINFNVEKKELVSLGLMCAIMLSIAQTPGKF